MFHDDTLIIVKNFMEGSIEFHGEISKLHIGPETMKGKETPEPMDVDMHSESDQKKQPNTQLTEENYGKLLKYKDKRMILNVKLVTKMALRIL